MPSHARELLYHVPLGYILTSGHADVRFEVSLTSSVIIVCDINQSISQDTIYPLRSGHDETHRAVADHSTRGQLGNVLE